jgi:hypothetical protein
VCSFSKLEVKLGGIYRTLFCVTSRKFCGCQSSQEDHVQLADTPRAATRPSVLLFVFIWPHSPPPPPSGPGPPYSRGFYITHDASQQVGHLWTSDRLYGNLCLTTQQTSMSPVRFESTISAGGRSQTCALDRAANGIGVSEGWRSQTCALDRAANGIGVGYCTLLLP